MNYQVADAANQKLRGGYYTPSAIADFLASWSIRNESEEVLEPSCGDGALAEASARRLLALGATTSQVSHQLRGVELYSSEAEITRQKLEHLGINAEESVTTGDFFSYDNQDWGLINKQVDVVVGNPPFLRFQAFPEDQRTRAFRIMQTAGLKPSRLTNSWVAFLVAASLRLKPNGRLAMVIPAELLQVKYAEETRAFLARHFGAITIITFRRLVFEGVLQEVVLLLAEKSPQIESGIDVIELNDASELKDYEVKLRGKHHLKPLDHAREKWIQYYLDHDEILLLRKAKKHPSLKRLGDLGQVDVGVVTGNNQFFVLNEEQVRESGLEEYTIPLVGRTLQLPGLSYSQEDWLQNSTKGISCHLLNLPALPLDNLPQQVRTYVEGGEASGVHQGYKCSIRKPWYRTPSIWMPDAFLFRQIHAYPKLVSNTAKATSTDTIHRVRFNQPEHTHSITTSCLNSLTFAFAEVMGRSYGGGVLELEPNEAEQLPIPFFPDVELPSGALDCYERQKQIDALLDVTDKKLLQEELNFSYAEVKQFRTIWRKLSARRMGRGSNKASRA